MELEDQWWTGQLAADIYQALRYKVGEEFGKSDKNWFNHELLVILIGMDH